MAAGKCGGEQGGGTRGSAAFRGSPARPRVGTVCAAWGGGAGWEAGGMGGSRCHHPPAPSVEAESGLGEAGGAEGGPLRLLSAPRLRLRESSGAPRMLQDSRQSNGRGVEWDAPLLLLSARSQLGAPRTGCLRWMRGDGGQSPVCGLGCLGSCEARSDSLRDGAAAPLTGPPARPACY